MNDNTLEVIQWTEISDQPTDIRRVSESERDNLVITATRVDGQWVILSRYGDNVWRLEGFTSNVPFGKRKIDFITLPPVYRASLKAMVYRYLRRGLRGAGQPKGGAVKQLVNASKPFLHFLETLEIDSMGSVTPEICAAYVAACKSLRQSNRSDKPLSQRGLYNRYVAVEALYHLSQYTEDQMPSHPWPETAAKAMAGMFGKASGKTPLIPDDVFCTLFEQALQQMEDGHQLLDLRDELDVIAERCRGLSVSGAIGHKNRHLGRAGWEGGLNEFNKAVTTLRTACYVVLASTSGCRNHELANLQSGAHHRTENDDGTIYHWMRSLSEKTDVGIYDWMIPEVAVRALRLMERWSAPLQAKLAAEIAHRRRVNPQDPHIVEALKHRRSLFLGLNSNEGNQVRTLSSTGWDGYLKEFAKDCGLSWKLASHQFRRKFANYAAHSRFGDLRYLKEHYAHWSLDMTLGYAMDDTWGQHLDIELFDDIQLELEDIKIGVVDGWMEEQRLAGGYGQKFNGWKREPQNLLIFKDHASMLKSIAESTAIRSNGHAWCTADSDGCVGNTLERSRCSDCSNSVIGSGHAPIYKRLYSELKELMHCQDIGEGGRQRVERDLNRCRDVLVQLGMPPEALTA